MEKWVRDERDDELLYDSNVHLNFIMGKDL